jgi:outer membrane lipoprotein-sorting protein
MKRSDSDNGLGERLRELEVPEHAPEFFANLEAKLEAEAASRGRAEATAPTSARASDARGGFGRRTGGRDRVAVGRRGWWRLAWAPVPVALVVLALLWAFAGPLGIGFLRPQTASAAEIKQKMAAVLSEAKSIKSRLVVGYYDEATERLDETRWNVVTTAQGDFRLTGLARSEDLAYEASTGIQRVIVGGENGEPLVASELTGLAPGWPDPGPADWVLVRDLGSVVRAMLAADDPSVAEASFEGRAVWVLSANVEPNRLSTVSGDHIEVTVDQQTGFPVKVSESKEGRLLQEVRLEGVQIDPVLAADQFTLSFPEGVEVERNDQGFRRVSLGEVAGVVGYHPLVPDVVPEGYRLTEIAVSREGGPTGKEGMNPVTGGVVSLAYRRGFDRVIVTTRLVGDDPSLWSDPLASGEGFVDNPEKLTLDAGSFAGSKAELLVDPRAVPHLWATNGTLVLTVSGDLTRAELLAVAESLASATR